MTDRRVRVHRLAHRIKPDPSRTITRFFAGSDETNTGRIERVLSLSDTETERLLAELEARYGARHPDIAEIWIDSFERVATLLPPDASLDAERKMKNVVYTRGSMLHNGSLIIPYALGDVTTTFAWLDVNELIASLVRE